MANDHLVVAGQAVSKWHEKGFSLYVDAKSARAHKLASNMGVDSSLLSPEWSVESSPHEESGEMRMTVRGVTYKRQEENQ